MHFFLNEFRAAVLGVYVYNGYCHFFVLFVKGGNKGLLVKAVGLAYAAFHKVAVNGMAKASLGNAYKYVCCAEGALCGQLHEHSSQWKGCYRCACCV